jgi:hypothetical protein
MTPGEPSDHCRHAAPSSLALLAGQLEPAARMGAESLQRRRAGPRTGRPPPQQLLVALPAVL